MYHSCHRQIYAMGALLKNSSSRLDEREAFFAAPELVNPRSSYTCSEEEGRPPVFGLLSRPSLIASYRSTSMGIAVIHLAMPDAFLITAEGYHRINFGCSACRQPSSQKRHRAHYEKGDAKRHGVQGAQAK